MNSLRNCHVLLRGRFNDLSCGQIFKRGKSRQACWEGLMSSMDSVSVIQKSKKGRNIFNFVALAAILFFAFTIHAQQGWSKITVLKQSDQPATVNAVFYDGDNIWLVGANGLVM